MENPYVAALVEALIDSAKIFAIVLLFSIILSFIEDFFSAHIGKNKKLGPLLGSLFGVVPQCGFSVLAADLYVEDKITIGTLVAVFISCSDESMMVLIGNISNVWEFISIFLNKVVIGLIIGYLMDIVVSLINRKKQPTITTEPSEAVNHDLACCHHSHEEEKKYSWHKNLVHPLLHSLIILGYVLAVNIILSMLIVWIGEENIANFIIQNKYLAPIFAALIGLIPNCVSSVLITELFVKGLLNYGSLLSGLIINAGLGLMVLFKNRKKIKDGFIIITILFVVSLLVGYIYSLILGF